ncbi:ABC transporter substrate-binding protein [Mycobacterium sp. smrl_JER01]|uniref:ABC transporter substrate-binding protein n=1 Tax=Mycobacterium sp. smrl_JER01 TaxID=3402633 RepID=UPI003AC5C0F4
MFSIPGRRPAAAALSVCAVISLAACSSSSAPEAAPGPDGLTPVEMAFEWTCSGDWAVVEEGLAQGIFERNGVALTYDRGQGGSDTVPLVAAREFDIGILSAPPAVIGAGQGMPLTIIGAAATVGPVTILADPSIKTPQDLQGRSLAVQTDQFEGAVWQAFTEATGIDAGQVDVVPRDDASEAEFLNGSVDALVVFYPTASTKSIFDVRPDLTVMPMQEYVPTYGHTFVANNDFLRENADAAKGFVTSWAEAAKYVQDNYQASYDRLVAKCPEVAPEALKFSMDAYFQSYTGDYSVEHGFGSFSADGVAQTQQVLLDAGLTQPKPVEEFISQDYQPDPPVMPSSDAAHP